MNFNAFETGHLIYTVYFILLLIFALFRYDKTNRQNLLLFFLFVAAQIVIGGLRSYMVGTDTGTYVSYFIHNQDKTFLEIRNSTMYKEPFFYMVAKIVSQIHDGYYVINLFYQLVFWACVSFVIYKHSDNCLLALVIFLAFRLHFFAMSGMRQAAAMGFTFLSFHFLIKDKKWTFIIMVLFASLFHTSALILISALFLRKMRIYNHGVLMIVLMAFFFMMQFVLPNISFGEDMMYGGYLSNEGSLGNVFSLLMTTLAFALASLLINKQKTIDSTNLMYNLSFIAFLFSLMSFRLIVAYRIAMYFAFFIPLALTNLIGHISNKKSMAISLIIALFVIYILTGVPIGLTYSFYWEDNMLF